MPDRDKHNTTALPTLRIAFGREEAGEVANQPRYALSESLDCGWLIRTRTAGINLRHRIVFAPCRATRQPAQHRQLPHMRQGVGYGPLKQPLFANVDRLRQCKLAVNRLKRRKEALLFFSP